MKKMNKKAPRKMAVGGMKGDPDPKKKVVSGTRYPGMGNFKTVQTRTTNGGVAKSYEYTTQSMDTTGYAKGKQNFDLVTKKGTGDLLGSPKVESKSVKTVSRKDVPTTLKSLQKKKKGGTVTKGMGFKVAQKQIAKKQGLSMERAGAILAAGARKASPAAKRKNPNLKKVKG